MNPDSDEIVIAGKRFVSAKRLAENTSYTPDHLGRLCRLNKLECRLFGRVWFVNPESFEKYKRELTRGNGKNGNNGNGKTNKSVAQDEKTSRPSPLQRTSAINSNLNDGKPRFTQPPVAAGFTPTHSKKEEISETPKQNQNVAHDSWDALFHHHPTDKKIEATAHQDIPPPTSSKKSFIHPAKRKAHGWVQITKKNFSKKDEVPPESPSDTFSVLSSNRLSHPKPRVITPSSYHPFSFQKKPEKPAQTLGRVFPPKQTPEKRIPIFSSHIFSQWKKYVPIGIIGASSVAIVILLFFIGNALLTPGDAQQTISQKETIQETEVVYAKSARGMLSYIQDGFLAARGFLSGLFTKKGADTKRPLARIDDGVSGLEEARERLLSEPEPTSILPTSTSTGFIPEDVEISEVIGPEVAALEKTGIVVETAFTQPLSRADVVAVVNDILSSRFVVGDAVAEEARVTGIVNRILARSQFTVDNAATQNDLNALENKLRQEIFKVGESGTREVRVVERQVALTNKIDQLPGVTLINATVSGTFDGLTDAHIPNDITASDYLPLSGGTLTGAVTFSGSSATTTFAGNILTTFVATVPHSFGTWEIGAVGANPLTASFVIDPATADSDVNLFSISVGGSARFLVDAEGDVFANSFTAVGGVTLSTTTASDFTVENTSTFGDSTTTDRTYFNSRIGSSLIPTADNLLDIGDTANALAWRTGIFGTSLGIGTTSPYAPLSVVGEAVAEYFTATSTTATSNFSGNLLVTGSLGVGTTSPSKKLSVTDTVSDAQVAIAYDDTRYAHLQVDSAGDLVVSSQGGDIRLNNENLFVCASGSCPSGTPSAQGSIIAETEIGIGTSSPTAQFGVANNIFIGGGGAPSLGTATSTFEGDIIILGKLDVGTIDPAYTIGGTTYATYGHSTVGVKEEVVVNIALSRFNQNTRNFERTIDFDELPEASDLWLFYQITDFGEDWENLVVSATAGFQDFVFYKKIPEQNQLTISSAKSGEIALRLIAPRFDSDTWGNIRPDQNGWKGFILNIKEKIKR